MQTLCSNYYSHKLELVLIVFYWLVSFRRTSQSCFLLVIDWSGTTQFQSRIGVGDNQGQTATRNIITHVESIFRKKDSSPFDIGVLACDFSSYLAEGRQEFIESVE